jgi:hypothetical protein
VALVELMRLSHEEWDAWPQRSPIRRAGYAEFRRNVAVGLGNWLAGLDEPPGEAVAVLRDACEGESELVREHAAWALGQNGSPGLPGRPEDWLERRAAVPVGRVSRPPVRACLRAREPTGLRVRLLS